MTRRDIRCVLLADRHQGLNESIRDLLATEFEVIVMVGDERSLVEAVDRMSAGLAVVDLSLTRGDGLRLVRSLHARFPLLTLIAMSVHDEAAVRRAALGAGAAGFVAKAALARDLMPTIDDALTP